MTETVISAIAPSLIVGIVLFYWERRQKKHDNRTNERDKLQIEADMRRLDLEVATAQLSYAVAMAVKRGRPNGEIEEALESYNSAMKKFRQFERKQLAINDKD